MDDPVCPFCGEVKGALEKQACSFCWAALTLRAKREWYKRRNALLLYTPTGLRAWWFSNTQGAA